MQKNNTRVYLRPKFHQNLFFTFLTLIFASSNLVAQEINTVLRPNWVKEHEITKEFLDSVKYPKEQLKYLESIKVFEDCQINVDEQEIYLNAVRKLLNPSENHTTITLEYSSKDILRNIISIKKINEDKSKDITNTLNWTEYDVKQFVSNRVWEAQSAIQMSIDNVKKEEFYSISFKDKNLRDDYDMDETIFYSTRDSIEIYFRLISKHPLNHQTFNGFPPIQVTKYDDYYEYVAQGLSKTTIKGYTPDNFNDRPYVAFSKFEKLEEVGVSFINQLVINESSETALDELYEKLSADKSNDSIIIRDIINYMQDTMIYQGYGNYRSYQPEWCIKGNRGDCKAKSFILIELLKRLGVEAIPILVNSPSYNTQLDSFPTLFNFNHVIVQFVLEEDTILVDPTLVGQTDKIGGYFIDDYNKSLAIYKDEVKVININGRNKGKLEIYDEFRDTLNRKIVLTGDFVSKFNKTKYRQKTSIFDGGFYGLEYGDNLIHNIQSFYYPGLLETELLQKTYNTLIEDSVVLNQSIYYPDTVEGYFLPSSVRNYFSTSFSSSDNGIELDSLYKGLWPLEHINEHLEAVYYKEELDLIEVNLDTIDQNVNVIHDYGYYKCSIQEFEDRIEVVQDIYISGSINYDTLAEFGAFLEFIEKHQVGIKNCLLRKETAKEKKQRKEYERRIKKRKAK